MLADPGLGHRRAPVLVGRPVGRGRRSAAGARAALQGSVGPEARRPQGRWPSAERDRRAVGRGARPAVRPANLGVFARARRRRGAVRRQRHHRAGDAAAHRPWRRGRVRRAASRPGTPRGWRARRRCVARWMNGPAPRPAAARWCGRLRAQADRSRPRRGLAPVTGRTLTVILDDAPRRATLPGRRRARRPRRPPAGRAGRRQRAVARRRRGDDAAGPAGHLDQRGALRRQHPPPAGPGLLAALPDHRDRRTRAMRTALDDSAAMQIYREFVQRVRARLAGQGRTARPPSRRSPAASTCATPSRSPSRPPARPPTLGSPSGGEPPVRRGDTVRHSLTPAS